MHYAASIALLAGFAAAQSNVIQITNTPAGGFEAGVPGTITWATTDTTDVSELP